LAWQWITVFGIFMEFNQRRGQHFLLSKEVRDFTVWDIAQMTDEECLWKVTQFRWGSIDKVICPSCGSIHRPFPRVTRNQLRCRHCDHHFSPWHSSPFADRKMPIKKLLMGISLFAAGAKGVPALYLSRVLDVQDKTATALTGKLREVLTRQRDAEILEGVIEMDGGHFCGKPRQGRVRLRTTAADVQANLAAKLSGEKRPKRKPRNRAEVRNWARRKLRRIVMVVREQHPIRGQGAAKTRIAIGYTESARVAERITKQMVKPGCLIMTDENAAYNMLSCWYEHKCVEHSVEFSTVDGVNENQAESFFSRLRRAEYGTFHGFRPKYLFDYAQEFAWREDVRRFTEGQKVADLFRRIFANGLSRWWRGYWQGHHRAGEYGLVEG
jgi:ISXO2-like transposase domain/Transposase zinc-ribbon domain